MMTHPEWISIVLLCTLAGCTSDKPQQQSAHSAAQDTPAHARGLTERRPAQKSDSIRVEGSAQPMTLRLYEPPAAVRFYTYVPSDMIPETRKTADGEAHYFFANFAGKRNDNAYLLVFVPRPGATQSDMMRLAAAWRDSHRQAGFTSSVEGRAEGDRLYFVARYYPSEYGDGFGPRAERIMQEWHWMAAASPPRPE